MALIKAIELPGTGMVLPEAYHVVSKVDTTKRFVPMPAMRPGGDPLNGGVGYFGLIFLQVFASKEFRDAGKAPAFSLNPAMPESPIKLFFPLDMSSNTCVYQQAYSYLKTLPFYADALEV